MSRPQKFIPLHDIKGLKTLMKEGKNPIEIAEYYKTWGIIVDRMTITRRIEELKKKE